MDAKAILKKTFWIILGAIGVALAIVIILPLFFGKKENQASSPIGDIIEKTKSEINKVEIDAQIELAKADGKEDAVINELQKIKEEPDRKKRLERLAKLLN